MIFKVIFFLLLFLSPYPLHCKEDLSFMKIKLGAPRFKEANFKNLLERRFSCRDFQDKILALDDITSIIWAAVGRKQDAVTEATRTIPSAGATYPLELYLMIGKNSVDKLKEGIYHYNIQEHSLEKIFEGDRRKQLSVACLGQDFIQKAPVSLIIAAKFSRTTDRYGARGRQYVYMESGHACQNIYLAAANLGLGTVEVGAFVDEVICEIMGLDKDLTCLIVMPIGYPR